MVATKNRTAKKPEVFSARRLTIEVKCLCKDQQKAESDIRYLQGREQYLSRNLDSIVLQLSKRIVAAIESLNSTKKWAQATGAAEVVSRIDDALMVLGR